MLSIILLGLMTIALASHAAAGVEGVPPIPGKAFDVEDYTVAGSETLQATFRLKAPYPYSRIMAHYLAGVGPAWTRCESRHPGWQVYVDTSAGTPRVVHQVIRYWVSFKQKKMLSVIVRHYSGGSEIHCQPDTDTEQAVVVVSQSPNLPKEINLLGLACGVHAPPLPRAIEVPSQCTGN